jgi:hypothetical protein
VNQSSVAQATFIHYSELLHIAQTISLTVTKNTVETRGDREKLSGNRGGAMILFIWLSWKRDWKMEGLR